MSSKSKTLIVQKFGGSSMGSIERIQNVARRAVRTASEGHQVVVVVSAMQGETDRLLKLAAGVSSMPTDREIDVLLATGEQVSIALLALAIRELGHKARSFLGHQVEIRTDSMHGSARIRSIKADPVHECLQNGEIVVIAGFQGVDQDGNITTLGRGGSDLSAVAMAAALNADACEIYSDVDGIYTTDPNVYSKARKIPRIGSEEMLELASLGAKVLQTRSVEFALKYKVTLHCRSSFSDSEGSWVVPEMSGLEGAEMKGMEGAVVTAVSCDKNTAKLTIVGILDKPGAAARLFAPMAEAGINVDVIIQNPPEAGRTDVTFTVPRNVADRAVALIEVLQADLGFLRCSVEKNLAKVSVVGAGMVSQPGVAQRTFAALGDAGINIRLVSTSEIKISCVVEEQFADVAVRVLHDKFELEKT
jgi:aspartate kinase